MSTYCYYLLRGTLLACGSGGFGPMAADGDTAEPLFAGWLLVLPTERGFLK